MQYNPYRHVAVDEIYERTLEFMRELVYSKLPKGEWLYTQEDIRDEANAVMQEVANKLYGTISSCYQNASQTKYREKRIEERDQRIKEYFEYMQNQYVEGELNNA